MNVATMSRLHRVGQSAPAPLGSVSQNYYANLQTQIQSSPYKQTLDQYTGGAENDPKVQAGVAAAQSLAQNGYDPSSTADNANLVTMISGGMCLAGPVGCMFGGMVEALWTVGNAIGCPVSNAFASVGLGTGCDFGCHTTGTWTPATILAEQPTSHPKGSFAALAWAALAHYRAQQANCQAGFPPDVIVDATVAMWNAAHEGPAEAFFVPPLNPSLGPIVASTGSWTSSGRSYPDPNVEYAFDLLLEAAQSPFWGGVPDYFGPGEIPGGTLLGGSPSPPRTVMVNAGAPLRPERFIPIGGHIPKGVSIPLDGAVLGPQTRPTAGFYVPLAAGVGAALFFSQPLLALAGLGLGLILNRKF